MPAPTLSGTTIINLGPLTSWTATASCAATTAPPVALALAAVESVVYLSQTCDVDGPVVNDCFPSAGAVNSLYHARKGGPERFNFLVHHSPAYECPSGWATVAYGVRDEASSHSLSGIFADPTVTRTNRLVYATSVSTEVTTVTQGMPMFEPPQNLFMSAMEPSETVILCCPRSVAVVSVVFVVFIFVFVFVFVSFSRSTPARVPFFTDTDNSGYKVGLVGGNCYSRVPREAYTATTGCQIKYVNEETILMKPVERTFTYHGRVVTGSAWSVGDESVEYVGTTMVVDESTRTLYEAILYTPAITMVNRGSAAAAAETSLVAIASATPASTATGPAPWPSTGSGSRRAPSAKGVTLLVWGIALLAGVALMAPV
ncbi:hypothetical protein CSHISOI_07691 [Colletotrichum shisoi]|uniref:Uncharacterized protein n=1 Tax=Colletotrichum shisoi TaxID=2078593 RepID=A0A5Q4BLD8_9PEZI|nr:hypothetical protein CSHISOI_07691 [Colletotrichum shisoi]